MGMDRKEFLRFRNRLIAAGIVSPGAAPQQVYSAYESILGRVSDLQASGAQMTPDSFIDTLIRQNGADPSKIGGGENFGETKDPVKPFTQTERSVYDLRPEDARMILEQTLQQKLGRNPTEAEVEDFIN